MGGGPPRPIPIHHQYNAAKPDAYSRAPARLPRDGPLPGMAAEVARAQKKKNRPRRKDRTTCQGKPRPLIETRFVGESVSSLAIFVEELGDLLIGPRGNLCVNLAPEAVDTFGN